MSLLDRIADRYTLWQIREHRTIQGWLKDREALGLYRTARGLPAGSTVLEIGSWKGKSTVCLAKGLGTRGTIFCVDPFDATDSRTNQELLLASKGEQPLLDQFRANLRRAGVKTRIEVLQGLSHEVVDRAPPRIDFLFIDGNHTVEAVDLDFRCYSPRVPSGGVIAFHDFYEDRTDDLSGARWVVHNRMIPSGEWEVLGVHQSLWVGRRK